MVSAPANEQHREEGLRLFRLLSETEARCLRNAPGLPHREELETTWEGVLFSVGGRVLIAPLSEVKEILNFSMSLTPVPGTKKWVLGIANIRGNLLPIVDLQSFLLSRQTVPSRRSRVLVLDHAGVYTGLLVDQMVGIRHFHPSDRSDGKPPLPEQISRFVLFCYGRGDEILPVFSMRKLSDSPEFQFAAA